MRGERALQRARAGVPHQGNGRPLARQAACPSTLVPTSCRTAPLVAVAAEVKTAPVPRETSPSVAATAVKVDEGKKMLALRKRASVFAKTLPSTMRAALCLECTPVLPAWPM